MSNYINNEDFLVAMIEYKKKIEESENKDEDRPPVPDYIGECFLLIAERLSYRPNFINYAFKEDMISDGIENCLQYVHNFNPEKSKNPFAYFTQIIYYAFIRRIQKEKKQAEIKQKLLNRTDINQYETIEGDDTNYNNTYVDYMQKNVSEEKPKKEKEKKPKKKSKLEFFMK